MIELAQRTDAEILADIAAAKEDFLTARFGREVRTAMGSLAQGVYDALEYFDETPHYKGALTNPDLNALKSDEIYSVNMSGDIDFQPRPEQASGVCMLLCLGSGGSACYQVLYGLRGRIWTRRYLNTIDSWTDWYDGIDDTLTLAGAAADAGAVHEVVERTRYLHYSGTDFTPGISANDIIDNGVYFSSRSGEYSDGTITGLPFLPAWLEVTRAASASNALLQIVYPFYPNVDSVQLRVRNTSGSWSDWKAIFDVSVISEMLTRYHKVKYASVDYTSGTLDANTISDNAIYFCSRSQTYPDGEIANMPYAPAWLMVTRAGVRSNILLQVAVPYDIDENQVKLRIRKVNESWSNWYTIGGGGTITNNITYEITQNSYSLSPAPTIVSGLPYVLEATGDSTDRTADIAAVLSQYGACQLGTGDYYVSGLNIPDNASLRGSGIGKTIVRLIDGAETLDVYAIAIGGTRSSVSDLTVVGGGTAQSEIGKRHGIVYQGTYISPETPGTYPVRGQISNVHITGFTGAGILCQNTSMKVESGVNVSNVNVYRNTVGVLLRNYSEYNRFTNAEIDQCTYGVINNGGNNTFVNCAFNKCSTGFLIDNSNGDVPNNGHGGCIGCTINHSGSSNDGIAIRLDGVTYGFVFSACQVFYGEIILKDSTGIQISNCNFGNAGSTGVILTLDGGSMLFSSDLFHSAPTVTKLNTPVVNSASCYLHDGSAITI